MAKKARRGLSTSLGFRVLSISLIFLGLPLIIYSGALYLIDYRQYVRNLYEEVDLIAKEEIAWIQEKEVYHQNTLTLIEEFIKTFHLTDTDKRHNDLTHILKKFTSHENISAIVYSKVTPSGQIICEKSTLSLYKGVDFSRYFNLEELRHGSTSVFITKDPVFHYSMYVVRYIHQKGRPDAVVMTIVSLKSLLSRMLQFQNTKGLEISIIDEKGNVITTTNNSYVGKTFSPIEGAKTITLDPISYVDNGMTFSFKGKKSFVDIRQIPKSSMYLMISVPEAVIMHSFLSFLMKLGLFLVFVVVVGGVCTYLFTMRMARPMRQLSDVMTSVGTGHLESSYVADKFGFEINSLGEAFNEMRKNLLAYIEEIKKEKGMKESFEKELQIGHQIQKAILPSEEPHIKGVDIATYYSPAKEVAGDFYDYLEITEDQVLITIADGVGKGISSCLYSFDLRSILRTASLQNLPLDELVIRTNKLFCADTKESCNFVTLVTGYLNKKERTYQFTDAGHLPIFIKRKGAGVEQFSTKGIALGIELLENVETNTVTLGVDDYLVMYTDGITEALNEREELYSVDRLIKSMEAFEGNSSQEFADKIMSDVHAFVGAKEQHDDISLVVIQIEAP